MRDPLEFCLAQDVVPEAARVVRVLPDTADWAAAIGPMAGYLRETGFGGRPGECALLPGSDGVASALLVIDAAEKRRDPYRFAGLPGILPKGVWRLDFSAMEAGETSLAEDAVLGVCLGAYRFGPGAAKEGARVAIPQGVEDAVMLARACWLGRDLVNLPANQLGPVELAEQARAELIAAGASVEVIGGAMLEGAYPCLAAVGAGSDRHPRVVVARWSGSRAGPDAPLVSLVGKGVCFDTGGYDIKPSAAMLRMKKDMGGAALMLAVALVAIWRDLPIRLELRLGCVENSVSGHAMRPGDILRTRAGLTVEVGNTDAEGRLVLCDLLTEACEAEPDLLLDAATLTGAARVALGPDLPAVFGTDDAFCETLLRAGYDTRDDLWRLPLWDAYDAWLDRKTADLGNVSDKPMAGAITAALFLRRFVKSSVKWAHFDTYAWNDTAAPGRPAGGETLGLRAISEAIRRITMN
ncbi:leucyl aminopeptidase family protein [Acidomonas methanolica]|uniref:leucyl aminopeptidase family protein n=1 Tax=Acidomonas methanolica TaxID=437 RepID=UPI00211A1013|nr:leucyl aminopeptidase family protein [Acidomonas methanolica]MCQ9154773.1 leucyl aminopeptidase family protein [Acidomonas methanolica]